MRPPSHPKPHANERARLLCSGHLRVGPVARLVDAATPPPLRPDALFCACPPLPTTAGIKKQACINRKCLLMVPRDEDGERLARKRAKQRTLPPGTSSSLRLAAGASSGEFGGGSLSLTLGGLGQLAMPRCMPIDDDNSELGSPISTSPPSAWGLSASTGVSGRASPTSEAEDDERAQSRNDRYLSTLALDDDDPAGRALTSAMLFAAIRTPESSPQRERAHAARSSQHSPLGKRGGASPRPRGEASERSCEPPAKAPATEKAYARSEKAGDAAAKEGGGKDASSPSLALLKAELGLFDASDESTQGGADGVGSGADSTTTATPASGAAAGGLAALLTPAFTAQIAAKLELDEPPKPPRLDELHEEFLLLNAAHRNCREYAMVTEEATAPAVLAF